MFLQKDVPGRAGNKELFSLQHRFPKYKRKPTKCTEWSTKPHGAESARVSPKELVTQERKMLKALSVLLA